MTTFIEGFGWLGEPGVDCKHGLTFASCGDTGCPLHGEYEATWSGRGASIERTEAYKRLVIDHCSPQRVPDSHEAHTTPVKGCLRCDDGMAEARELMDEGKNP